MKSQYIVEMEGICKSFYDVQVLKNVRINVAPGEVLALVGENGAGKSTLMNILCGLHQPDAGTIKINGEVVKIANPRDAYERRIAMVHQEICLVEQLSIADNVFLGSEPKKDFLSRDKETVRIRTQNALDELDLGLSADTLVETLSVAQQQMIEVARAVCFDARVVIFDEPTASLTEKETEMLFKVIRRMQEKGIGIVYISHRLEEIFQICQRVTVLRDSQYIDTCDIIHILLKHVIFLFLPLYLPKFRLQGGLAGGESIQLFAGRKSSEPGLLYLLGCRLKQNDLAFKAAQEFYLVL